MGQKVNPIGFRTGITEDWKSKWYAPKAAYGAFLIEDFKLRRYIDGKLNRRPPFAAVSDILIERTREEVTVTLKTARPGLVIGPKGAEVDKLREELEDLIKRKVAPIKVIEIKNPDLNAQLVLVDTPGLLEPKYKLQQAMLETALAAIADADVVLCLLDASRPEERPAAEGPPRDRAPPPPDGRPRACLRRLHRRGVRGKHAQGIAGSPRVRRPIHR